MPDEIFSSWLCRIAQENQIKLHTLEVQIWGRDKQIWTRDIDRSIDDVTLSDVASITGVSFDRVKNTCLRSYESRLFEKLTIRTNSDWILPSGIYHRVRKRFGMQFCPLCLATDSTPYFRKTWRLAIATFCDRHDVMLHDRCPQCQSPIMFHRQEMGNRNLWMYDSLATCTACGFDLKRTSAFQASVIDIEAYNTLKSQLFFLDVGWTFSRSEGFQYSHLYFCAVRQLAKQLRSKKTPHRILEYANAHLGLSLSITTLGRMPIEFLSLTERHYLILVATWLLLDWPERLLRICGDLGVRHSELLSEFGEVPYWFESGMRPLRLKPIACRKNR